MPLRIATFNLENFDITDSLEERMQIMRPQLQRISADILCLQEIHSEDEGEGRTLAALDQLLAGTDYAGYHRQTTSTVDGDLYAERNIVTLSRFPFAEDAEIIRDNDGPRPRYQHVTANPPDNTADFLRWERPLLYSKITLADGQTLHLVNLHLKSKIASNVTGQKIDNFTWRSASAWAEGYFVSSMKRVGQALQVRLLIDSIFDNQGEDALIAIVGDFNAEANEVPVRAISGLVEETGNPDHASRIMIACENNVPESSRFSLLHLGRGEMIDHIMASRALIRYFDHTEIHNEALPDESGAFRTDNKFPESDHAPVIAEFNL